MGFGEVNADSRVGKRYAPPAKRRKVEEESDEGLSTSDKISIGALAVCGTVLLATAGKFIWDVDRFNGGLPKGNNSCYMNALIQVLYRNISFCNTIQQYNIDGLLDDKKDDKVTKTSIVSLRQIFDYMDQNTAIQNKGRIDTLKKNLGHQGRQEDPSVVFPALRLYPFLMTTINVQKMNSITEKFTIIDNQDLDRNASQYIVRLNRVTYTMQKTRQQVNIRDEIQYNGEQFKLTSVIIHSGELANSGHYYAYCMSKDGDWYCYNDHIVTQVSYEQVKREAETDGTNLIYTKISELENCLREAPNLL